MSEHIGGKGSGASSSSEFLRAYRIGVLAGANASYSNIPKKAAISYTTAADLLEARNQRGILADLSSILVTESTCPVPYIPGQHRDLVYVSTNLDYANLSPGSNGIAYTTDGVYATVTNFGTLRSIDGYYNVRSGLRNPNGVMQSLIDGKIYITSTVYGTLISVTIGGLGYSTVVPSGLTGANGITQDNSGNFYVSGNAVYKVTPSATVSTISPLVSTGITYASDGNLYVTTPTYGVYQLNTLGAGTNIYSTTTPLYGITQANDGNLYICGPSSILRMDLSGQVMNFAPLTGAYGITQGADENFYITATSGPVYQIVVQ